MKMLNSAGSVYSCARLIVSTFLFAVALSSIYVDVVHRGSRTDHCCVRVILRVNWLGRIQKGGEVEQLTR
jgi:hypothetical protein